MTSHPHKRSSRNRSSKESSIQGRPRPRARSGSASGSGNEQSPNERHRYQDDHHGAAREALTDTSVGDGRFGSFSQAISQLNVSYHPSQASLEPDNHTHRAYIGSWALETAAEEPVGDIQLTLSHSTLYNTGPHRTTSHPVLFSLASDSTAVDYWSNAPIHTDAWHLIEPTQTPAFPARSDEEEEHSDMGATGSASPEGAQ